MKKKTERISKVVMCRVKWEVFGFQKEEFWTTGLPKSLQIATYILWTTHTQQHWLITVSIFRSTILILIHHPQSSVIKIHWKIIAFQFKFQPPNVEGLRPSCKGWRTRAAGLAQWRCHGAMFKMMIWPQWRYWHEICSWQSSKIFVCLFSWHFHFYSYFGLERDCMFHLYCSLQLLFLN